MDHFMNHCGIVKEKSLVLEFATTQTIDDAQVIVLLKGKCLMFDDNDTHLLFIVVSGKISCGTNYYQPGFLITKGIFGKQLHAEQNTKLLQLPPQLAHKYMEQLKECYEQFNCILEGIFKIEMNITDMNCIRLIKSSEDNVLMQYNSNNRDFFILLDGGCKIRKFLKPDQKQEVSINLNSTEKYYMLGEESLFSSLSSQKITSTRESYFMKVNAERFCRYLPVDIYSQLRQQHKSKNEKIIETRVRQKPEQKTKSINARDIMDYYSRAAGINNRKIYQLNKIKPSTNILQKFCEKNQSGSSDYMNYFIESTEQKVRFQLISKGYRKGQSVQKVTHSLSKDQIKKMLRKKVINELKTTGKSRKPLERMTGLRSKPKSNIPK